MRFRSLFRRPREVLQSDEVDAEEWLHEGLEDFPRPSLEERTWRAALRTKRVVGREWRGFTYQAAAQFVGASATVAFVYLVTLAGGFATAVPLAIILSVVGLVGAIVAVGFAIAPKRLVRARASELMATEPGRAVASLGRIFGDGDFSEWDILEALEALPERSRTILILRYGEPMTLARIGEAFGLSSERVRQIESRAIEEIGARLGAQPREPPGA